MKRVLVVEDLPQVAEHLKGLLGREAEIQVIGVQAQAEAAITQAATERPDVAMVDALLQGKVTGFDVAKRIRMASPGTRIVIVTVPQKPVTARAEEAIDAVFVLPGGANEIADALGAAKKVGAGSTGMTVAVYSPKGGTGRTLLTVNLASVLRRQGSTVAVFDAVMQYGSVRHFLQVPPDAKSIVDLPAGGGMKVALPSALWEGPAGVQYLLAPPRPEQAELVSASEIQNAIGILGEQHEYTIVDTQPRLSDDTLAALDSAKAILLVITYGGPGVVNARAAIETFDMLGYRKAKPLLVVLNQADETGGMSKGALEHSLGVPVAVELPTDRKLVAESIARQEPFTLAAPSSALSKAVANLATTLISQQRK